MYDLYPHQWDAVAAMRAATLRGCLRPAAQMPTGSGKTIVIAELVRGELMGGQRSVVVAPRREIVRQLADTITDHCGVAVGFEMDGFPPSRDEPVVVASNCSLGQPNSPRLKRAFAQPVNALYFDEAHRAPTSKVTWSTIAEAAGVIARRGEEWIATGQGPCLYGLSATLQRADGDSLASMFDECVYTIDLPTLVEQGFLARPMVGTPVETGIDLGLDPHGEDFLDRELESLFIRTPQRNAAAVDLYRRCYADRQFIAFLPGVATAQQLAEMFKLAGYPVACIHAETPPRERDRLMTAFRRGQLAGLTNCSTLTEGTDLPMASLCLMMRPTMSAPLYTQMAGRVLRSWSAERWNDAQETAAHPCPWRGEALGLRADKPEAIIVDFVDNSRHPLQTAPSLVGGMAGQLHLVSTTAPPAPGLPAEPLERPVGIKLHDATEHTNPWPEPVQVGSWQQTGRDQWKLLLPDSQGAIAITWHDWGGYHVLPPGGEPRWHASQLLAFRDADRIAGTYGLRAVSGSLAYC